jgi:hypothetical protein
MHTAGDSVKEVVTHQSFLAIWGTDAIVCKTGRSQLLACNRNPKNRATSLVGSSAFSSQTRSFPSLPYGRFGFILYCKVVTSITSQLYLNVNRYIYLFLHNYSQVYNVVYLTIFFYVSGVLMMELAGK